MAIDKNKKGAKAKGLKKKLVDPFSRKEWCNIKAPAMFKNQLSGRTIVNKTSGQKISSDALKGRVFQVSLADLMGDEQYAYRKLKLICEDVQGDKCITNFHGMDISRDKMGSLIRKWQTLIEAHVDVKTADGYLLRMFCIAFTKKQEGQRRKTCYCQGSHIKKIRRRMMSIMRKEAESATLKDLFKKLTITTVPQVVPTGPKARPSTASVETVALAIENSCKSIFPLQNVYIRKVKVLKRPRFDLTRLMDMHQASEGDAGEVVTQPEEVAVQSLPGHGGRL